jgi:serine-type D-Ala-D-Ala carboxypeptidase/endopeptidase (penicillin-binding protein 4)
MRRVVLTWGVVLILLAAVPAAAAAQSPGAALTSSLAAGMRQIGGASGAYVVDLTTGQPLFAQAAGVGRMPASVEKLYTTSTALLRFGPAATLTTTVLGSGSLDSTGIWHGILYLRGGGDPTFGSAAFDRSAYGGGATMQRLVTNLLHATHLKAVQGRVVGDASYFDSLRGTPASGYGADLNDTEGLLSGLAYDRGFANFAGTVAQTRPALYATRQFVSALRAAGVQVPKGTPVSTGHSPAAAQRLAVVKSPPISRLIALTNTPSDNYLAEMLLKDLGARFGGAGTTAAGAAVVRSELASQFGSAPRLVDGSGLSRSDTTTPRQVVTLLAHMESNSAFINSLATGGETGTLRHEMLGTPAQGACHGKTGTLHDVAALAGYCLARDGHELAFAFLANGVGNSDYAHSVEGNAMAPALARYNG